MATINGNTALIAHIGYPTSTFKAPMIYNPYFDSINLDAVVVPMVVKGEDFATAFPAICRFTNFHGALITMPHKVTALNLMDEVSPTAEISGACNAVRRLADGRLIGDMFDGEGFVRGLMRKCCIVGGRQALVIGCGGVGSAIAASLAGAGIAHLCLHDVSSSTMEGLAQRLGHHYPDLNMTLGSNDPAGADIVVNATPLGMKAGDPMPLDVARLGPQNFVGEVVMKKEKTAFLNAAEAAGCRIQIGIDMLFEQIPAYLEFFGFPTTTPDILRARAHITY